jgi:hypothetical protein
VRKRAEKVGIGNRLVGGSFPAKDPHHRGRFFLGKVSADHALLTDRRIDSGCAHDLTIQDDRQKPIDLGILGTRGEILRRQFVKAVASFRIQGEADRGIVPIVLRLLDPD